MPLDKSVIVVGAGAAGVAAATRLYERGMTNITVLEAQNRIGGRINSIDLGEHGLIDLGAQWVHGEKGNVVCEMAQSLDMLTYDPDDKDTTFVRSSGDIVAKDIADKATTLFDKIMHSHYSVVTTPEGPIPVGTCFTDLWNKELENDALIPVDLRDSLLEWCHQVSNTLDGCDNWFDNALSNYIEYAECPGNQAVNWKKGGYANVFKLLLEKVNAAASGDFVKNNVKLNHKVIFIEWNNDDDGVTVICENGAIFKADHVIVTVSLAVLKRIYKELFKFKLPQFKVDAIEGLGIGTVDKIFLFFPHRWWPEGTEGFSFLWKSDDKKAYKENGLGWLTDVVQLQEVNSAPNALLAWIVGESARKMETIPEEELKLLMIDLLKKFLSAHYKIPDITMVIRSTWHTNANVRGSYSFRSLLTDKLQTSASNLSSPIENSKGIPTILFAGEATNQHHYSTVHGAVETGWNQAENILKIHNKTS